MKKPATKLVLGSLLALSLMSIPLAAQEAKKPATLKNTVKQKLKEGKQVFSHTISSFDIERYCEEAPHYDFTWFEMQHSTMTWGEIEKMMNACPHVGAMPFIRMPDELESSIQKATDLGAIGIIMPTTETPEKAHQTAWYTRYPPVAHRSAGGGNCLPVAEGQPGSVRVRPGLSACGSPSQKCFARLDKAGSCRKEKITS